MGWVRVDDAFYDHGKFAEAGPLGMALWLAGLAYSNRNLTDGFVATSVARRLIDLDGLHWRAWEGDLVGSCETVDPLDLARHLVGAGLWEDAPGGFRVHDYHDYQPSADQVRAEREKNAARKAAWRERHAGSPTGTDGETDNETPAVSPSGGHGPVPPTPKPNPKKSKNKNTPSSADADSAFDHFWNAYPRKVGKLDARRVFDRKRRDTDPELIVVGAERLRDDPNLPEPEFIPHPATWLGRGGWDDEPLPPRSNVRHLPTPNPGGIAPDDPRLPWNA